VDEDAEVIILSAHLDTFHVNPGSFDNLTGVVTLLEIARALVPFQARFVRRLRLVIYTGEEYGFLGSRAYIAQHSQELDRIPLVFNMDSLWPATADGIAVMWSPEMRDYIANALAPIRRSVEVRNLFCMSSDYLPFLLEGIACARPAGFEAAFPPYSHTRMDTPDKIPADWVRLNAMSHAQLLARILTDPESLPTRRKTAAEVQALLDKEAARELIRVYGFSV
jgi:Zn-dependent M28 family amino/carboxypeptidase